MMELAFQRVGARLGNCDLADVVRASELARLKTFIRDEESEALKIFHAEQKDNCFTGDWYGEHAGKWLVSAGLTYSANPSEEWRERIAVVVSFLVEQQEADGYLGTYAKESAARMTHGEVEKNRTWDVWTHAWLLLGLLAVADIPGCEAADGTAKRIGELLLATFVEGKTPVGQGNHKGLSSLVLLEPLALMAGRWGDNRYSELALKCFDQAVESGLKFGEDIDASLIGTGKAYQLIWCLKGLVELAIVADRKDLLKIAEDLWVNIREFHLTPMGGPWGGVATHKEVFNEPGYFDPYGLVETCSSTTWMVLGYRLFEVTGETAYLAEVEKTLYNSVIAAIDENGSDWCYFTFPNGRRNNTYHWACCKSSGALGLAEAEFQFVAVRDGVAHVTMLESCGFETPDGVSVDLLVEGDRIKILSGGDTKLAVYVSPSYEVVAMPDGALRDGDWLRFDDLKLGETELQIRLRFWVEQKVHTVDHHGQEIVREEYVCARRGRYVYAVGKFEGYRMQETLRMPQLMPDSVFDLADESTIILRQAGRDAIKMTPYWLCGGRHDGAWRSVWLQVAWQ